MLNSHAGTGGSTLQIAIVGPGALGLLFAARLVKAGVSTMLLDHRRQRAAHLAKQGIRLIDAVGVHHVRLPVTADPRKLAGIDAAIILVKAYQTDQAAAALAEYLPATARVLTVQNGLGNVETLQLHFGRERVFGGTTAQGGLLEAADIVRDTGHGPTVLGTSSGQADPRLDDLCQALMLAGFAVSVTDNLPASLWSKVIVNAAINPVGALTRKRNGELAEHASSMLLMIAIAREAEGIARRHGIQLETIDWSARLHGVCQATASNKNSMLQDILNDRRTEIDAINGAIVRVADCLNMRAPINRTLWHLVQTVEMGADSLQA